MAKPNEPNYRPTSKPLPQAPALPAEPFPGRPPKDQNPYRINPGDAEGAARKAADQAAEITRTHKSGLFGKKA